MSKLKCTLEEAASEYLDKKFPGYRDNIHEVATIIDFKAGALWAEQHSPKVLALVEAMESVFGKLPSYLGQSETEDMKCTRRIIGEALADFRRGEK